MIVLIKPKVIIKVKSRSVIKVTCLNLVLSTIHIFPDWFTAPNIEIEIAIGAEGVSQNGCADATNSTESLVQKSTAEWELTLSVSNHTDTSARLWSAYSWLHSALPISHPQKTNCPFTFCCHCWAFQKQRHGSKIYSLQTHTLWS